MKVLPTTCFFYYSEEKITKFQKSKIDTSFPVQVLE